MRSRIKLVAILGALMLVLVACGGDDDSTDTTGDAAATTAADGTTAAPGTTAATGTTAAAGTTAAPTDVTPVVTCLVTDLAGVDDRSFNAAAWAGVESAEAAGYVAPDPILLESDEQADYQPNIDQCIAQGAEHIVTVGFELG